MKKGKTNKLTGFRTFKSQYGTIDSTNLKSIYLNIQTWVEPKQEPEYEEEYSGVGSQVFNTMAGNLIQPKQNVTTEDFWAESPSMGMFNTSNAKCPVCGLPESIMQRSVCFDKNCGLKK